MKLTAENYKLPCTSCLFVLFMLLKCAHTNKSNNKVLKALQGMCLWISPLYMRNRLHLMH